MKAFPQAEVVTFLNEIADQFPSAVALAAGRPTERFLERLSPATLMDMFTSYAQYAARDKEPQDVRTGLLQYGRTAGIITDLVAQHLRMDQGVNANPDRTIITSGCQEALAICLQSLCPTPGDVALVCNPTYIGATGAAYASGVEVFPISNRYPDLVEGIERAINELHNAGRCARVLYLIPTFDNPTGRILNETQRKAILDICLQYHIVILEDNSYGMFLYDGEPVPPMAALDDNGCVIYLSTFSKTISPAMRVGSLVIPEMLFGKRTASRSLWSDLVQRKGFLTLNTSQITQAIVGGLLLKHDCSLRDWIKPSLAWYKSNRDVMVSCLRRSFASLTPHVSWNQPRGGFFLSVELPFRFDGEDLMRCVRDHGVIVMPMSFFSLDNSQDRRIRLSFSATTPQQIEVGVTGLRHYVQTVLSTNAETAVIDSQ